MHMSTCSCINAQLGKPVPHNPVMKLKTINITELMNNDRFRLKVPIQWK